MKGILQCLSMMYTKDHFSLCFQEFQVFFQVVGFQLLNA